MFVGLLAYCEQKEGYNGERNKRGEGESRKKKKKKKKRLTLNQKELGGTTTSKLVSVRLYVLCVIQIKWNSMGQG